MVEVLLNDWPGWLLIFLSFFILYEFWKVNKAKKIAFAIGFVLLLHHLIAIVNAYFFTFPGAEPDPVNFYHRATEWAISGKWMFLVGDEFYVQLLGIFYRIFGPSQLLGEELSVLAFLLSCFVLVKIVELLNISKCTVLLLLIYGLLPTNLIFCSKILRESYQILFFMLSVYWGLRFHLKPTKGAMISCVSSALVMGLFHKALILYSLFLVPVLLLFSSQRIVGSINKKKERLSRWRWIFLGLILVLIIGIVIVTSLDNVKGLGIVRAFLSGKGLKYAAEYRMSLNPDARANYGHSIPTDTSSIITFVRSILLLFIYYVLAPFPWQVANWLDLYGMVESLLRFLLITLGIISWYRADGIQHRIRGLLLVIYFSMTFLWAMGTVNYGTSIRHHILTNWIIIILGAPMLIDLVLKQFSKKSLTFKSVKRGI